MGFNNNIVATSDFASPSKVENSSLRSNKRSIVLLSRIPERPVVQWAVVVVGTGNLKGVRLKVTAGRLLNVGVEPHITLTFVIDTKKHPRHHVLVIAPVVLGVLDATVKMNGHCRHVRHFPANCPRPPRAPNLAQGGPAVQYRSHASDYVSTARL